MNEELDNRLCDEFPLLYRDRDGDDRRSCMPYGFPGDGWFQIIYDLSAKLEPLIAQQAEDGGPCAKAFQVKEKFGTLRFYMENATGEMLHFVYEAEMASMVTCERCGAPGKTRVGGWLKTLCDECHEKRGEKWD